MPNPEQPPSEPTPERKESFEDFGIEVGDRVYDAHGAYLEVGEVINDPEEPDGYLVGWHVEPGKRQTQASVPFTVLLKNQKHVRVEKPPLPANAELLPPRHRAALKQIAKSLDNPQISDERQNELRKARADLLWQLHDTGQDDTDSTNVLDA